jgi:transposase
LRSGGISILWDNQVVTPPKTLPDDIAALQTALLNERAARQQAEARASGAEAMVAHLKLLIAKMKRERFGQSAERGRKLLDQFTCRCCEKITQPPAPFHTSPALRCGSAFH